MVPAASQAPAPPYMENKPEPRVAVNLPVRVFGMGADGHPFFQNAHAIDISSEGAKLSGLEHQLTPGDVVGVQLGDKKARCRVVWVIDGGPVQKIQAGVQMLEGQQCPWKQELGKTEKIAAAVEHATPGSHEHRRFVRHKLSFPMELRDERGSHMRTQATDISGRGCYIETLMPLARETALNITFWIDSEKVHTTGIVRACDGGVGMGIEFTGLDLQSQERLQHHLEKLDPQSSEEAQQP